MECDYGTCNMIMGPWIVNRGRWNLNMGPWNVIMGLEM